MKREDDGYYEYKCSVIYSELYCLEYIEIRNILWVYFLSNVLRSFIFFEVSERKRSCVGGSFFDEKLPPRSDLGVMVKLLKAGKYFHAKLGRNSLRGWVGGRTRLLGGSTQKGKKVPPVRP